MISKKNLKNIILANITRDIVLFEDVVDVDNIDTEYVNEFKPISDEAKEFMDKNFSEKQKRDSSLCNSELLGLTSFDFYGGKIFINFEKGNVASYLATIEPGYINYIENGNYFVVPISSVNIVTTKDKKIILLNEKEKMTLPIGFLDEGDIVSDKIDFQSYFMKEIARSIGDIHIFDSQLLGVFKSNCCFLVMKHETDLSSREIEKIWSEVINIKKRASGASSMVFMKNKEEDVGDAIKNSGFSHESRVAFKFYVKNVFYNYKHLNIKIE